MTKREFAERISDIHPESANAVDDLAALFEEDYLTSGKDLKDPAVSDELLRKAREDLHFFRSKYDALYEKLKKELRKAGATEAQINWGLFGNIELRAFPFIRCNLMAKRLIRYSYQITLCLAELKMLSKYTGCIDPDEIRALLQEYKRRF